MNKALSASELQAVAAITTTPPLSKKEMLDIFAGPYIREPEQTFVTMNEMEHVPLKLFRRMSTVGTPFELGVRALNEGGVPTKQTFSSLMDMVGLTTKDLHDIACDCHHGDTIDAGTIAVMASFVGDDLFSRI